MSPKLWSKGYDLAPLVERYCAARNASLDIALVRYDLLGSLAHAQMLHQVGLLTDEDWHALDEGLRALYEEAKAGTFGPTTADEDIHTLVELTLTARGCAAAKKLHLGRSRNDQVLVDLRLYVKEALIRVTHRLLDLASCLTLRAITYEWVPIPGYTHMQRAMLSSVGLWLSAYAESLLDDCMALGAAYTLNDQCPLGSAAAYGAPLPLDRAFVAKALGFAQPHHNVLTAANSRGKAEAAVVQALALIMVDLSKLAQDILLYTTTEFGFFSVPDHLCDGSSIMPQKHNLSALELVRARAQHVVALQGQMLATLAGLPSGYNMDYQETKAPLLEAVDLCAETLSVVTLFVSELQPNVAALTAACSAELFATDHAYALAQAGLPFRDAYVRAASAPGSLAPGDLVGRLRERTALGAPGNLELPRVLARVGHERAQWEARETTHLDALTRLLTGEALTAPHDAHQSAPPTSGLPMASGI